MLTTVINFAVSGWPLEFYYRREWFNVGDCGMSAGPSGLAIKQLYQSNCEHSQHLDIAVLHVEDNTKLSNEARI